MAIPSTALSLRDIEPARAVTSPSLATWKGTPHFFARSRKMFLARLLNTSRGTPRNREAIMGRLLMMTPAELPPMASTLGIFAAGGVDLVVVVGGILLIAWLPDDLFAEDRLSLHQSGYLTIACPEIEPDAVPVEMTAEGNRCLFFRRHLVRPGYRDLERALVRGLAHELRVERSGPFRRIGLTEVVPDGLRSAHAHPVASFLPEEELEEALHIGKIEIGQFVPVVEDRSLIDRGRAIGAVEGHHKGHGLS